MRILVTGASGFVGAMVAARLLGEGHEVRAFARTPARAHAALAAALVYERPRAPSHRSAQSSRSGPRGSERGPGSIGVRADARAVRAVVLPGDVFDARALRKALASVEVAYYLIHSMERAVRGDQRSFAQREREAALRFGEAAAQAGVRRIVYLGGLVPDAWSPSRHLASRLEVERVLLAAVPDSLALRASIVIGARSRSFRLLVRLIERVPVLALPPWRRFRTQPIDARDLLEILVRASALDAHEARSLDVAGPEPVTYEELLTRIAELMVVGRPRLRLKLRATGVTARLAAAIASEGPELTSALMEGLGGDLLPRCPAAQVASRFGVTLHGLDAAIEHALGEWEAVEPLAAR